MSAKIERLRLGEGERWRSIRLSALSEAPHAFSTTYADAVQWSAARWQSQVSEFATFVAVVDGLDVGVARGAVQPESDVSTRSDSFIHSRRHRRERHYATYARSQSACVAAPELCVQCDLLP